MFLWLLVLTHSTYSTQSTSLSIGDYEWKPGFCYRNISICENHYRTKLLKPLEIGDIPLKNIGRYVRYYNYNLNYIRQMSNKNKRGRSNIRRRLNEPRFLLELSYSEELDYIVHICDIHYDKLDKKTIKLIQYKYRKAYDFHTIKKQHLSYFYNMGRLIVCYLLSLFYICY